MKFVSKLRTGCKCKNSGAEIFFTYARLMDELGLLNSTEEDSIRHLTRTVERTAEAYRIITEQVFSDGVMSFGRIYVWHAFSCEFYDLLTPRERSRLNQIYKRKWWTLFLHGEWYTRLFLSVLMLVWTVH